MEKNKDGKKSSTSLPLPKGTQNRWALTSLLTTQCGQHGLETTLCAHMTEHDDMEVRLGSSALSSPEPAGVLD
jgi:hypothetical protein